MSKPTVDIIAATARALGFAKPFPHTVEYTVKHFTKLNVMIFSKKHL